MLRTFLGLTSFTVHTTIKSVVMVSVSLMSLPAFSVEESDIKSNNTTTKNSPLVIESQVKGSQEQPNVIYIMPWQGIENSLTIEGGKQKINMPNFKPINPKSFKKQSVLFYNLNNQKAVPTDTDN
jgi:hypothetical protein